MDAATKAAIAELAPAILSTTARAVKESATGLDQGDAHQVARDVIKEVVPVIINQTNLEPWYQSRTTLSQYMTIAVAVLGLLGYTVTPEYQQQIIAAVLAVGVLVNPLVTLYSRWIAKKPLGT